MTPSLPDGIAQIQFYTVICVTYNYLLSPFRQSLSGGNTWIYPLSISATTTNHAKILAGSSALLVTKTSRRQGRGINTTLALRKRQRKLTRSDPKSNICEETSRWSRLACCQITLKMVTVPKPWVHWQHRYASLCLPRWPLACQAKPWEQYWDCMVSRATKAEVRSTVGR